MKTNSLVIAFVAIFVGTTLSLSAQTKSVANKKKAIEDEIELLQAQAKLDSVKRVLNNADRKQAVRESTTQC